MALVWEDVSRLATFFDPIGFIVAYRLEPLARGDLRSAVRWAMRNRTV
jgi:hypothetical protein